MHMRLVGDDVQLLQTAATQPAYCPMRQTWCDSVPCAPATNKWAPSSSALSLACWAIRHTPGVVLEEREFARGVLDDTWKAVAAKMEDPQKYETSFGGEADVKAFFEACRSRQGHSPPSELITGFKNGRFIIRYG